MIFIDTSAFIARYLEKDQFYQKATTLWKRLGAGYEPLITSNFVLDETLTLLARWAAYPFAVEKGRIIYESQKFTIIRISEACEREALDLFEKFSDQRVSFTDCTSFSLMKEKRIKKVFTFDRHFRIAGFVPLS